MNPTRIQLSRRTGFRLPPGAVSVARPTRYGNPHRVGFCPKCGVEHTAEESVSEFRAMMNAPEYESVRRTVRAELRGRTLGCWCKIGEPCHADILISIANS